MLRLSLIVRLGLLTLSQRAEKERGDNLSRGIQSANERNGKMKVLGKAASVAMIASLVGAVVLMVYPEVHTAFCTVR